MRNATKFAGREAFTVTELLVGVAIIALLVGLLMTVLGSARENGRRAACLNNLRQVALAMNMAAEDNGGQLPAYFYAVEHHVAGGVPYSTLSIKQNWSISDIGPIRELKLLLCPSDGSPTVIKTTDATGKTIFVPTSYGYNFELFLNGIRVNSVRPDKTVLLFDGLVDQIKNTYWFGYYDELSASVDSDDAGEDRIPIVLVSKPPPDTQPPSISITSPTTGPTYSVPGGQASISLAGVASDNDRIAQVTWSNNRGGSGTALGKTNWSVAGITLQVGDNVITVTAHDATGNTSARSLTVTRANPASSDTEAPTVNIASPTTNPTHAVQNAQTRLDMAGTASDNIVVAAVTWSNDRGGSGTATGTANWSVTGITLKVGYNVITITARDAAGNSASRTLTVSRANQSGGPGPDRPFLCHTPPGNPDKVLLISPNDSAYQTHWDHGDPIGPCPQSDVTQFNKQLVDRRHRGKTNVIFLDGHAEWRANLPADGILP